MAVHSSSAVLVTSKGENECQWWLRLCAPDSTRERLVGPVYEHSPCKGRHETLHGWQDLLRLKSWCILHPAGCRIT
jgi:hypothetical protein